MLDAGWRALAYCLMPQVIWLSLLPLLLAVTVLGGLAWWGWGDGVAWVRALLDGWSVSQHVLSALDNWGLSQLRMAVAPLVLVLVVIPLPAGRSTPSATGVKALISRPCCCTWCPPP